jgi:electron transfer flavoprotein alpha/beta subunit
MDDLIIEQTVKPPVIFVVGDLPNSYIRVPTLKDKMKYSKKEIEKYSFIDLGIDKEIKNDCELINLEREQKDKNCLFISSDSPFNDAKILYQDYLKEKIKR